MVLQKKIKYFFLLFVIILEHNLSSQTKLPVLIAKQTIYNLRFISHDGRFTYYQNDSGDLIFSTYFQLKTVLKSKRQTQYFLKSSHHRKIILIEKDDDFHFYFSIRKSKKIFIIPYGKTETTLIGEGVDPHLHQNDTWISIFHPHQKMISFLHIKNKTLSFNIQIQNLYNPYFIPHVEMSRNIVYYTDINEDGIIGLLKFSRHLKKSTVLMKNDHAKQTLTFCHYLSRLYIMISGDKTELSVIDLSQDNIKYKRNILYTSNLRDLGHLICTIKNKKLYFIKNFSTKALEQFEVVSFDLDSKKIQTLSDLTSVTQLINMDGKLLIPFHGKFYVPFGENDMRKKDLLIEKKIKK